MKKANPAVTLSKMRRRVRREVYERLATLPNSKQPCCCAYELVVTMLAEERLRGTSDATETTPQ